MLALTAIVVLGLFGVVVGIFLISLLMEICVNLVVGASDGIAQMRAQITDWFLKHW